MSGKDEGNVVQIVPATGWYAVLVEPEGTVPPVSFTPVAVWAVVKYREGDTLIQGQSPLDGSFFDSHDNDAPFLCYVHAEEREKSDWHSLALHHYETKKRQAKRVEKDAERVRQYVLENITPGEEFPWDCLVTLGVQNTDIADRDEITPYSWKVIHYLLGSLLGYAESGALVRRNDD